VCGHIDLQARSIDEAQAADLRARLATFTEEWNNPEMDVYDGYDAVKAKPQILPSLSYKPSRRCRYE
jgi:hypothetical protein